VPAVVFLDVVRACDKGVLLAGGLLALWGAQLFQAGVVQTGYFLCVVLATCASAVWLNWLQAYSVSRLCSAGFQMRLLSVVLPTGALAMYASVSILEYDTRPLLSYRTASLTIAWLVTTGVLLATMRLLVARVAGAWCRTGRLGCRVALLGTGRSAADFMAHLSPGRADGMQIIGLYEDEALGNQPPSPDLPRLGSIRDLVAESERGEVDAVVITLPADEPGRIAQASAVLGRMAVDLYVCDGLIARQPLVLLGGVPVSLLSPRPLSEWQVVQKRLFDLLGSVVLLVMFSPILLLLALIVKLDSDGPVLFRQVRIGFNNLPFICFKFRTMYHRAADALADRQTTRDDPRVTPAGRWMRRLSLDELPQLLNVLRGEMSLVGPRPHAPNTRAGGQFFANAVSEYALRHRVKPGITGWAQVNGWRGETTTVEHIEQRVRHDLYYIQNWSLMLDLRILLRTALCGFGGPQAF
jgi:Undecaprenyl-phosphate glucose phosphotransferase